MNLEDLGVTVAVYAVAAASGPIARYNKWADRREQRKYEKIRRHCTTFEDILEYPIFKN